jgi:lysophospholipase L1-like esterase
MADVNRLETIRPTIGPGAGLPVPTVRRRAGWVKRLWRTLVALIAGITLLEVGLRVHDWLRLGMPFFWDASQMARRRTELANPFLLYRGDDLDLCRRAKTPEQVITPGQRKLLRIVCLGGSTTLDAIAFQEARITYPSELQRLLNDKLGSDSDVVVEVINAGFTGHSSLHALVLLETEVLQLKPDLVIMYENVNDLIVNYFPGPTTPAYANCFRHPTFLPHELAPGGEPSLLERSRVYTTLRAGLRPSVWYRVKYRDADAKVELAHAGQFRTNLRNIAAICKANGTRVMFGQQAFVSDSLLFDQRFKTMPFNTAIEYPQPGQVHEHFLAYLKIVREVAAAENVPCADPYSALKDRKGLFADAVHLHAEGARAVAREFARCLIETGTFDELVAARRSAPPAAGEGSTTEVGHHAPRDAARHAERVVND